MKNNKSFFGLLLAGYASLGLLVGQTSEKPYNILFISSDDLNDYVGFLGGHPQSKTPNMDRLATEGVVFERAYCSAALCNPSRISLMTGFRPTTSQIYDNDVNFRTNDVLAKALTIPQYLSAHGYFSMNRGKIFHNATGAMSDPVSWDLQVAPSGAYGTPVKVSGFRANGMPINVGDANFDWGPTTAKLENTPDYGNAVWAAGQLAKNHDKPFFLAVGIYKPHQPFYLPKEFFDKFPEDSIILPRILDNDLSDVPGNITASQDYNQTVQYNKRKGAVQAYLAAVNYADTCVGVVLDALRKSKYADNTIVIFWGDHGWHLGEKQRYKKFTPWEEGCRTPMIIKVPGITPAGVRCTVPVNLIDLYPTITELCGLPDNTNNEGESLVPLLKNPEMQLEKVSWTTQGAQTVRSNDFRYIRRNTGEELYDHRVDSMEWTNLAGNLQYAVVKQRYSFIVDSLLYLLNTGPKSPLRKNRIPGVMQSEKFDRGGQGLAYSDSDAINTGGKWRKSEGVDIITADDLGGGFCVTNINHGEWLAFTTDTIESGRYFLQARIKSTQSDGMIKASLDGNSLTLINVPLSPEWITIKSDTFQIQESFGRNLKYEFLQSGYDVNYFEFVKVNEQTVSVQKIKSENIIKYPSSVNGILYLNVFEFDEDVKVSLMSLSGKTYWKSGIVYDSVEIPVKSTWPEGLALVLVEGRSKREVQKVLIKH
jgi:arylsulfatase A-like enzyme